MIIERCRELALRAPARVVFPDALDQRVLKAAQYLHQQGLATPILVANPFELRQFALSHGVAMDGLQVIDPHGNLAMFVLAMRRLHFLQVRTRVFPSTCWNLPGWK